MSLNFTREGKEEEEKKAGGKNDKDVHVYNIYNIYNEDVHEPPTKEQLLNTKQLRSESRISIEDLSIPVEEVSMEVNNYLQTVPR